jgi:hypothetical protein
MLELELELDIELELLLKLELDNELLEELDELELDVELDDDELMSSYTYSSKNQPSDRLTFSILILNVFPLLIIKK